MLRMVVVAGAAWGADIGEPPRRNRGSLGAGTGPTAGAVPQCTAAGARRATRGHNPPGGVACGVAAAAGPTASTTVCGPFSHSTIVSHDSHHPHATHAPRP